VAEVLGLAAPELPEPPRPAVQTLPGPEAPRRSFGDLAAVHGQILARLGPSPLAEDQLIRDLALPPSVLTPALVSLELEGRIARAPGGLLSRAD